MSNSEIRFGVIGLGAIGRDHCEQIAAQKDAVLAAVADISEQSGQSFSDNYDVPWYRGYHELLSRDDVDVVVISTPSGLHGEITVAAARAGKHVLVEKPMEISLAKADEMIEECARNRVKLAVHYPLRFSQDILKAKKAIEMGLLGKLVLGEAIYKKYRSQEYYDRGGWRGTWQLDGGGVIMNQTIHPIDILQWFMGDVESVSALTRTDYYPQDRS
ncbi:MAG: Gfo/Idh/MocA family oxidoreductase [Actinobacteria bacterium]|nr:Gfo/Idh/MocA family oxidoreductase [Actinomycetota bacterium]